MNCKNKHREEDLKLLVDLGTGYTAGTPFRIEFSSGQMRRPVFTCEGDGNTNYTNCIKVDTRHILCLLDNHNLSIGILECKIYIFVKDSQMPDGDLRLVSADVAKFVDQETEEEYYINLTNGKSDTLPISQVHVALLENIIKGQDADIAGCNQAIANANAVKAAMESLAQEVSTQEAQRQTNENQRINAENIRKTEEQKRAAAAQQQHEAMVQMSNAFSANMQAISQAEQQSQAAEIERKNAEALRVANETTRQSKEAERQSAETTRQTKESTRQENEESRSSAETQRQSNETSRKNTFNSFISGCRNTFNQEMTKYDNLLEEKRQMIDDAVEKVEGAENIDVQLEGTEITVTDRNGATVTTDLKGEKGETGNTGPQGPAGKDADIAGCNAAIASANSAASSANAAAQSAQQAANSVNDLATQILGSHNVVSYKEDAEIEDVEEAAIARAVAAATAAEKVDAKIVGNNLVVTKRDGTTTTINVKGADGTNYTITSADYDAIADVVAARFTDVSVNGQ